MDDPTYLEMLVRPVVAAACAAAVGWQRERHEKVAGLRTYMMVAVGAATFTLVASGLLSGSAAGDPSRIVTGVATGIGFLGAGSIVRSGSHVEGVTSAAGIWVMGAVGAACGVGAYSLALVATALSLLILGAVAHLEAAIAARRKQA